MSLWNTYVRIIQSPVVGLVAAGVAAALLGFSASGMQTHGPVSTPHSYCIVDRRLVWEYVSADISTAIALFVIAGFVIFIHTERLKREPPIRHQWVLKCFGWTLIAVGLTKVMTAITMFSPLYYLEGAVRAVAAALTVLTAAATPYFAVDWLESLREYQHEGDKS